MKRLLQIELLKLRGYRAFWILIILYAVSMAGTLLGLEAIMNSLFQDEGPGPAGALFHWDINSFPEVWEYMSWIGGFFTYILLIVVVFLVSSEFTYKTMRQNVINGLSRMEFLAGKFLLIGVLALGCTLIVALISMTLGLTSSGFVSPTKMFGHAQVMLGYFIQTLGFLMIAFWVTLIVKRSGITIGILFLYVWFLENIFRIFWDDYIHFFPVGSMNRLTPNPFLQILNPAEAESPVLLNYGVALLYILLFAWLSARYLRNKDI